MEITDEQWIANHTWWVMVRIDKDGKYYFQTLGGEVDNIEHADILSQPGYADSYKRPGYEIAKILIDDDGNHTLL